MAALALGEAGGFHMQSMLRALQGFKGLPHRTQFVLERDGVRWYNDSKGTNVGATLAAIDGVEHGKLVLIAGGDGKGADFVPLAEALQGRGRGAVLLGKDAALLAAMLSEEVSFDNLPGLDHAHLGP